MNPCLRQRRRFQTVWWAGVVSLLIATAASAQTADSSAVTEGIPVESSVVRRACGSCHQADAEGRMTRISYQRTTPEGWQQTVRRMVLLNGLQIEAADAREAVRYLANRHGLAPEEARPAAFEVERRMVDHVYEADPETQVTCTKCHSLGRVISQRRSAEEWRLLTTMHQGYYPLTDFQSFYGRGSTRPAGPDGDSRYPVEKAIDHLSSAFPLSTPEWTAWSANMRVPRLAGTWALVGSMRGKGPVYGTVTVTASADAPDAFDTRVTYTSVRTQESVTRTGQAVVYTGFQWRGRSVTADGASLREVMFVGRDWREMSGRWFTGDHDEIGLDVTLKRVGRQPMVTGVYPRAVRLGAGDVLLTIHGVGLPADVEAGDVDLGPGIIVNEVVETSAATMVVRVTAEEAAAIGTRDLFIGDDSDGGAGFLAHAVSVYDRIDRIAVTPGTGMARVGGIVFPKRFEQFEARGYHHGPDGEPRTADDLDLGLVDVDWTLEEYAATYGDDDVQFVGDIDASGFFTPAVDGPNPERLNNTNNIGDVWVVATLRTDGAAETGSGALRARAHLLVTVPLYIRRDPVVEVQ